MNRKNFIKKTALAVVALEAGYLTIDALKNKDIDKSHHSLFKVGRINSFEKNKIYPFSTAKFQLSVLEDGGLLALSVKCTHLGCVIQRSKEGFACPCHASAFDKYGEVLSPPATRALDIFPISIVKGDIWVDTQKPIKRKKFETSQITYV